MPLPSSGPLSLNDIQTEFGGTNPIGLNEYYAGGGLVPAGTTGTNGAVPSSGAISIFNFYGTSNVIPYWTSAFTGSSAPANFFSNPVVGATGIYFAATTSTTNVIQLYKVNSSNSNIIWGITAVPSPGGTSAQPLLAIDSSENIFLIVAYAGNVKTTHIIKFDSSGNVLWQRQTNQNISNGSYQALPVVDSNNDVYFGSSDSSNGFAGAIYKVSSAGTLSWARRISNTSATGGFFPTQIAIDSSNNVYISGRFNNFPSDSSANKGGFAKLDTNGNLLGGVAYNVQTSTNSSTCRGIQIDSSGNIYFVISRNNGTLFDRNYIVKLNSAFTKQWERLSTGVDAEKGLFLGGSSGKLFYQWQFFNSPFGFRQGYTCVDTSGNFLFSNLFTASNIGFSASGDNTFLAVGNNAMQGSTAQTSPVSTLIKFPQLNPSGYYPLTSSTSGIYVFSPGEGFSTTSSVTNSGTTVTLSNVSDSLTTTTTTWSSITNTTVTNNQITTIGGSSGSSTYAIPGAYTWFAPAGVTSVSVIAISGGAGGSARGGYAGAGGGLAYRNNITVTPGTGYLVSVGYGGTGANAYGGSPYAGTNGTSSVFGADLVNVSGGSATGGSGGTPLVGTGGVGGTGQAGYGAGGGGCGGYSGSGGQGGNNGLPGSAASAGSGGAGGGGAGLEAGCFPNNILYNGGVGGFTGIIGLGATGAGGALSAQGGSGSFAYFWAGGGGGSGGFQNALCCVCPCFYNTTFFDGDRGMNGLVRIVWPGNTRSFPSTNVTTP